MIGETRAPVRAQTCDEWAGSRHVGKLAFPEPEALAFTSPALGFRRDDRVGPCCDRGKIDQGLLTTRPPILWPIKTNARYRARAPSTKF